MLLVRKKIVAPAVAATAKHIEIVRSTKPWLNSMSRLSSDAILAALSKQYTEVGVSIVNTVSDLEALVARQPDLVFLGMKFVPVSPSLGRHSPRLWLADYLDEQGIPYTGSAQPAHRFELNKHLAKQRVLDAGLATSPFFVARQNQPLSRQGMPLTFPLFIKPTDRGGGQGIDSASVVHNFSELAARVNFITTNLESDSLVEEYLPGREFSVAILKHQDSEAFSVMPIELIAPPDERGSRLLSAKIKSANSERVCVVVDETIKAQVTGLAMAVFGALGARDYGRIDIRLDKHGVPHFLEANLLPSLISGYGSFPKACVMNMHLEYEPMIVHIAELGLARSTLSNEDITNSLPALEAVL